MCLPTVEYWLWNRSHPGTMLSCFEAVHLSAGVWFRMEIVQTLQGNVIVLSTSYDVESFTENIRVNQGRSMWILFTWICRDSRTKSNHTLASENSRTFRPYYGLYVLNVSLASAWFDFLNKSTWIETVHMFYWETTGRFQSAYLISCISTSAVDCRKTHF